MKHNLDFTLLHIGYAEHRADWNWKNINSPFARIHLILQGNAKIVREDKTVELKENHFYLTPSHTRHGYECNSSLRLFYIHIYERPDKMPSVFDLLRFPTEIVADQLTIDLVERLYQINPGRELSYYDPNDYDNATELSRNIALQGSTPIALELESQAIIKQIFSRFFAYAEELTPAVDSRMTRVLEYIHIHIDTVIPMAKLAEISCLTKDHMIRSFKKQMNCTPGKYINRKKIEKAQLNLLVEDCSVQELAYKLGFDNVFYFNRLFKKLTGENPTTYRKRLKSVQNRPELNVE